MGTEYRLVIMDDFDWCDKWNSRRETTQAITDKIKNSTIEASLPYMIVVDIDRTPPVKACAILKDAGVVWDRAYFQEQHNTELILISAEDS